MKYRRMDVLGVYRVALGGGSDFIGFAVDGSAPYSATGEDGGEALGPMLTAGRLLGEHLGGSPEFAHDHYEGIVHQSTGLEVGKEAE